MTDEPEDDEETGSPSRGLSIGEALVLIFCTPFGWVGLFFFGSLLGMAFHH